MCLSAHLSAFLSLKQLTESCTIEDWYESGAVISLGLQYFSETSLFYFFLERI